MNLNYLKYRLKYRFGRYLPLTSPVDVSLELASQCNMRCSYCYHADQKNLPFHPGIMKYETASKILRGAARLGAHSIKTNWKGESTINKNFEEITRLAKNLSYGDVFMDRLTNSNFKFRNDREDIFRGLANQTKVKISYDSFRKHVFEKQRTGGDHDITTNNIDTFYNHPARIKSNTHMVIQAVRTNLNKDEDLAHEAAKRWPSAEISIRDMVAGRVDKDVSSMEHRTRDFSNRQSCLQAHVRLVFDWDGNAYPCCNDISHKIKLGNIYKQSMWSIFNGEIARKLREDLCSKEGFLMDPCKTCPSFESYKGFKLPWHS